MKKIILWAAMIGICAVSYPSSAAQLTHKCGGLPTVEKTRCEFYQSLGIQRHEEVWAQPLRTISNSLLSPFGLEFTDNLDAGTFAPEIMSEIKAYISASESDILGLTAATPETFLEKLDIASQVLEDSQLDGLYDPQKTVLVLGAHKLIMQALSTNNAGLVQINRDQWDKISNVESDLNKLKDEISSIKISDEKSRELQLLVANEISSIIRSTIFNQINNNNDINRLREEITKLRNEQFELGRDHSERIGGLLREVLGVSRSISIREFKSRQQKFQEIGNSIAIINSVLFLADPQVSSKISVAADSALKIASAINEITLAETAGGTGAAAASLGPYAAIAVAAVQIFQIFSDSGDSPDQVILDELRELSLQLDRMRREFHDRFNNIESILGSMHRQIMRQFAALQLDVRDLSEDVKNSRFIIELVRANVQRIDEKISTYYIAEANVQFQTFYELCIDHEKLTSIELSKEKYFDCMLQMSQFSTDYASLPWFTSSDLSQDVDAVADGLSYNDFEGGIGLIAKLSGFGGIVPNPRAWKRGADGLVLMRRTYTMYPDVAKRPIIEKVVEGHNQIQEFRRFLASRPDDLLRLIAGYSGAYEKLVSSLMSAREEYIRRNFVASERRDLEEAFASLVDIERRTPSVSVAACRMDMCNRWAQYNKEAISSRRADLQSRIDAISKTVTKWDQVLSRDGVVDFGSDIIAGPCAVSKSNGFSQLVHIKGDEVKAIIDDSQILKALMLGAGKVDLCYEIVMGPPGFESFPSGSRTRHEGKINSLGIRVSLSNPDTGMKLWEIQRTHRSGFCFVSGASVFGKGNQVQPLFNGSYDRHNAERPAANMFDCPTLSSIIAAPPNILVKKETVEIFNLIQKHRIRHNQYIAEYLLNHMSENAGFLEKLLEIDFFSKVFNAYVYFIYPESYLNDYEFRRLTDSYSGMAGSENTLIFLNDWMPGGLIVVEETENPLSYLSKIDNVSDISSLLDSKRQSLDELAAELNDRSGDSGPEIEDYFVVDSARSEIDDILDSYYQ